MIALQRRRQAIPKTFREPGLTVAAHKLLDLYFAAPGPEGLAFKASAWKPAKSALKKESGGKCAYCEAPTHTVAHGDVEHFRPKSRYWWLAFCFDNYLYSCQICNQSYKGNKFPVAGPAIAGPPMPPAKPDGVALNNLAAALVLDATLLKDHHVAALWAPEAADLVNPYVEDPAPLLAYEVDDANEEIWLRSSGSPRADRAVDAAQICLGINREELRRERYANYLTLAAFKEILEQTTDPRVQAIARKEVIRMQGVKEPFAGMRRYFAAVWGLPGPV